MKFRINGKKFRKDIESVLIKGKWNSGNTNKSMSLLTNIVISIGDESFLYNGDHHTFVKKRLAVERVVEKGRIAIDAEILLKYLQDEETNISLDDNILKINSSGKIVRIPILERHSNNDAILRTDENYIITTDMKKEVILSEKTSLTTRIKVSTKELQEAFKSCELVGNSIFQLDFDGEMLNISSTKNTEEVTVEIEPIETEGQKATMDVSAPFYKHIDGITTILSFNDDSPLSIISGGFSMLRAPRIER